MPYILHIVQRKVWEQARQSGAYRPPSLDAEGFIHFSTPAQTIDTANRFYRGQDDLLLLVVDTARLTNDLRYEPPAEDHGERPGERFPHVYGSLNLDAVILSAPLLVSAAGTFTLPPSVKEYLRESGESG